MKSKLLMIMQSTPFPARRSGLSMRYYPIIDKLKELYQIDIINLSSPSSIDEAFDKDIKQIILAEEIESDENYLKYFLEKSILAIKFLSPFHLPHYHINLDDSYLIESITQVVKNSSYDKIIFAGPDCCGLFVQSDLKKYCKDVIFDFIDSPYLLASRSTLDFFRYDLLKTYERWKTKKMECKAREKATKVIYISKVDATFASTNMKNIDVIPNGIFIYDHVTTQVQHTPPKSIGFFGDMGYAPNKEAVSLLLTKIFHG